jgi:choline kinase
MTACLEDTATQRLTGDWRSHPFVGIRRREYAALFTPAPYTHAMQNLHAEPAAGVLPLPLPAVVLAAGFGSRLGEAARGVPKALVPVAGRPLLAHTLAALAEAGVRDVCVVTGHRGAELEQAVRAFTPPSLCLSTVRNRRFDLPNASSLAVARAWVRGRPFLLLMADHLLSADAIARMLGGPGGCAVGVDRSVLPAEQLDEATKVRLDADGLVAEFGKRLPCWDGVDAGIFRLEATVFSDLKRLGASSELSALMTAVAARLPFYTVDLTGAFWLDVDTPEDLAAAEAALSELR